MDWQLDEVDDDIQRLIQIKIEHLQRKKAWGVERKQLSEEGRGRNTDLEKIFRLLSCHGYEAQILKYYSEKCPEYRTAQ